MFIGSKTSTNPIYQSYLPFRLQQVQIINSSIPKLPKHTSIIMCRSGILLLLIFLQIMHLIPFSQSGSNLTDMQSLLAIKAQITSDPFAVLNSWNQSLHFCQWSGVSCGRRHPRVVELDLSSSKLQGTLSPHVGNLSFLRTLVLENNTFTNHIPQELGRLFRLQTLILGNNSFSGVIPVNISRCTNLFMLQLQVNNLTGKLPAEFEMLSNLKGLSFYQNNLVGEIPASFGNLSSIRILYGDGNHLQGGIPSSVGQLRKLRRIDFAGNYLTGTTPPSIYNLSSLTDLSLSSNQLHGSLPVTFGETLPLLEYFSVSSNNFSGQIPVTISNASYLSGLELTYNTFTGKVPSMPRNLRWLQIAVNDLGNGEEDDDLSFLHSLANNTNLELLDMTENLFRGEFPEVVSNFSATLWFMGLGRNQIHGNIPRDIGNLVGLQSLILHVMQLTGTIPTSIGKLQMLTRFGVTDNGISGTIPSSIGNLTSLVILVLNQNSLQGRIPSSLGNCRNLLELTLASNKLIGPIPEEVIGISSLSLYLDLSGNLLTGPLPSQVGKLVSVGILNISNNKLSGEIPTTLASCISLESLDLGGNSFQGSIPVTLRSLKAIQYLNFSNNNLTGQVPDFLGDLKLLERLDLSFNGFEGEVPVNGVFQNASKISIIGNQNICGGIPQLNLPKCSSLELKSSTKRLLIVAIVCGCLGVILMICFLVFCYFRKTRNKLLPSSSLEKSLLRVSYGDLHQATNGFASSNLIGAGSFGSVYKGILNSNGMIVAVKVLNLLHKGASKSFIAECKTLTSIRHRNLVKVLTACSSIDFQGNEFKALVYEFMVNGSLDEWLHLVQSRDQTHEPRNLNLLQRLNIAVDIASAIDYLHHQCQVPIIHCDLKPRNVLLDADMTARVGDFGIARFLQESSHQSSQNQSSSIGLKGTVGYAAPEYGTGNKVSTYGDVYSFGILLLEMFTGKRPSDDIFKDGKNLRKFTEAGLADCILDVMDPVLLNEHDEVSSSTATTSRKRFECLCSVVRIGLACSAELPGDRTDITNAAAELNRIKNILIGKGSNGDYRGKQVLANANLK